MSIYCAEVLSPRSESKTHSAGVHPVSGTRATRDVSVLVIRERLEGFFLERLTAAGESLGDTEHDTLDEAMSHAHGQYEPISSWRVCPDDVNPVGYLRAIDARRQGLDP